MCQALLEPIKEAIIKIENYETHSRSGNPNAQAMFEHAVKVILFDLWIPDDELTPRVNVNYKKVPTKFANAKL